MDDSGQKSEDQSSDKLDEVKKRALEALAPLLNDLDVEPERKFDICMSALRFTNDLDLADVTLSAALAIDGNGSKAEALVELVNEIDYQQRS